jgi:predicted MFS family arabinose efflux permease
LGFVLGPLLGSELAALVSFRAAFVVAGCLNLLCLVPLSGLHLPVATSTEGEPAGRGRAQNTVLLYIFVGVCTLVEMGTALRITYLSIEKTLRGLRAKARRGMRRPPTRRAWGDNIS